MQTPGARSRAESGDVRIYEEFFRERARRTAMIASGEITVSPESGDVSSGARQNARGASDARM